MQTALRIASVNGSAFVPRLGEGDGMDYLILYGGALYLPLATPVVALHDTTGPVMIRLKGAQTPTAIID